jgi:hypothetical protein
VTKPAAKTAASMVERSIKPSIWTLGPKVRRASFRQTPLPLWYSTVVAEWTVAVALIGPSHRRPWPL